MTPTERFKIEDERRQRDCPHRQAPGTNIVWHLFDDKQVCGICTLCRRVFKPGDADYPYWIQQKSINTMSTAGFPVKLTPEEEAMLAIPGEIRQNALDFLSDEQIADLMEGVRNLQRK